MKYKVEAHSLLREMSVINSVTKDALKSAYNDLYDNQNELPPMGTCRWENLDFEYNIWGTECGLKWTLKWTLDEGKPSENDMNYCPKCGKKLIEYYRMSEV